MSAPTYSFKKEEFDEYGVKVETIDYGDISNSTLVRAFGDQMTYNDLEFYAKNEEGCTNLICIYRWFDEKTLQFKAMDSCKEIFSKSFDRLAMGIELFHILNELETALETSEDEEREEHSSLDLTPDDTSENPESLAVITIQRAWRAYQKMRRLLKEHLEDEAYGKNEGRSREIEIGRQAKEKAVKEEPEEEPKSEGETEEDFNNVHWSILNVFENYYGMELDHLAFRRGT